jgi:hypothetical protein
MSDEIWFYHKPQPVSIQQGLAVEGEAVKRSCLFTTSQTWAPLGCLPWSRSALCHPRVLVRRSALQRAR